MKKQIAYVIMFVATVVLLSCTGGSEHASGLSNVSVRLTDTNTEIVLNEGNGQSKVLAKYPYFAGLSPSFVRREYYLVKYSNNNLVVLVPDDSSRAIIAWNDLAHPFNVVFVDAKKQTVRTLLKAEGLNIRMRMVPGSDTAFIFLLGEDKTCTLTLVGKDGKVEQTVHYSYSSYPSIVSVSRTSNGYLITNSNIDDDQTFFLNMQTGEIRAVSYKKNSMVH